MEAAVLVVVSRHSARPGHSRWAGCNARDLPSRFTAWRCRTGDQPPRQHPRCPRGRGHRSGAQEGRSSRAVELGQPGRRRPRGSRARSVLGPLRRDQAVASGFAAPSAACPPRQQHLKDRMMVDGADSATGVSASVGFAATREGPPQGSARFTVASPGGGPQATEDSRDRTATD